MLTLFDARRSSATYRRIGGTVALPSLTNGPAASTPSTNTESRLSTLSPSGATAYVSQGGDGEIKAINTNNLESSPPSTPPLRCAAAVTSPWSKQALPSVTSSHAEASSSCCSGRPLEPTWASSGFSPDGRRLLILDSTSRGEVWRVAGGSGADTVVALPGVHDLTYVSEATTENGRDDWTLLLTVAEQPNTDESNSRLMRWSVDDGQTLSVTDRTNVDLRDATSLGPSLTIGDDGGRGLLLRANESWRHLPKVTADDVTAVTAVDLRRVAISHGDTVSLLDLASRRTYDIYSGGIYTGPEGHHINYLDFVGSHRLAAVDFSRQLTVVDTSAAPRLQVNASAFAMSQTGGSVQAQRGTSIKMSRHARPTGTEPQGPVVEEYRRSMPSKQRENGENFTPHSLAISNDFVAAVGGTEDDDYEETALVTLWRNGFSRPVVQDQCRDPLYGDQASAYDELTPPIYRTPPGQHAGRLLTQGTPSRARLHPGDT